VVGSALKAPWRAVAVLLLLDVRVLSPQLGYHRADQWQLGPRGSDRFRLEPARRPSSLWPALSGLWG